MERPTVLLAVDGEVESYRAALERAGFAPSVLDAAAGGPAADLAVLDCDQPPDALVAFYRALRGDRETPTSYRARTTLHHSHNLLSQGDSYRLKQKRKAGLVPTAK